MSTAHDPATDRATRLVVANAPVSYGAFELTVGLDPAVPDALTLLDEVAGAGYAGIDLGPAGYLGEGEELAERLSSRGLGLAGGYLELPFSEPHRLDAALGELETLLDTLDAAAGTGSGGLAARPTLADAGSPARSALPGRAALDRSIGLDDAGWRRLADGVARAAERCRERGYEPTFHHHTATYVEAKWEIERLLELTDVGLTLDTGHLLLGRGEPVSAIGEWGGRINHVHLKDAQVDVLEAIVDEGAPVEAIWRRGAFCALGTGDVDIDGVLAALDEIGYAGWLVVEQDIIPDADGGAGRAAGDQVANRAYLKARGI
jgi:inosose dehydratase